MVDPICCVTKTIHPYECDWKGDVLLSNIMGMMMLASEKQERQLPNPHKIYDKGLTWIVIQHEMTIHRLPRAHEEVILETEALSYNKFFTYRAYRTLDTTGNVLIDCESTFAMLDVNARKLVSVDEDVAFDYPMRDGKVNKRNTRLPKHDFEATEGIPYRVRISDIDFNLHVNNAKYFDWIQDSLTMDFLKQHAVTKILVKYEKEVLPESTVLCQTESEQLEPLADGTQRVATHHVLQSDGYNHAHLYLEWVAV